MIEHDNQRITRHLQQLASVCAHHVENGCEVCIECVRQLLQPAAAHRLCERLCKCGEARHIDQHDSGWEAQADGVGDVVAISGGAGGAAAADGASDGVHCSGMLLLLLLLLELVKEAVEDVRRAVKMSSRHRSGGHRRHAAQPEKEKGGTGAG